MHVCFFHYYRTGSQLNPKPAQEFFHERYFFPLYYCCYA